MGSNMQRQAVPLLIAPTRRSSAPAWRRSRERTRAWSFAPRGRQVSVVGRHHRGAMTTKIMVKDDDF
jgi:hypothetical protein